MCFLDFYVTDVKFYSQRLSKMPRDLKCSERGGERYPQKNVLPGFPWTQHLKSDEFVQYSAPTYEDLES